MSSAAGATSAKPRKAASKHSSEKPNQPETASAEYDSVSKQRDAARPQQPKTKHRQPQTPDYEDTWDYMADEGSFSDELYGDDLYDDNLDSSSLYGNPQAETDGSLSPKKRLSQTVKLSMIPAPTWGDDRISRKIIGKGLKSEVKRHVSSAPECYHSVKLSLEFKKHEIEVISHDTYTELLAIVTGTVNGKKFQHRLKRSRCKIGISQSTVALGSGGLAGLGFHKLISAVGEASGVAERGRLKAAEKHATDLRDDLLFELLEALDAAVGRPGSNFASKWNMILIISACVFVVATIVCGIVIEQRIPDRSMKFLSISGVTFSAFIAIPAFFSSVAFGLATLPTGFFENETFGKKLVKMSGASSAKSMKPVCICLGIGMLLVTVALVYLATTNFA